MLTITLIIVIVFVGLPVAIAGLSYGSVKFKNYLKLLEIKADFKQKALNVQLFEKHTAIVEEIQALAENRRLLLESGDFSNQTEVPTGKWKGEPIPKTRPSRGKWNQTVDAVQ